MWNYVQEKRQKLWIWKALDWETDQLLDWECGRRDQATLQPMVDRLALWDEKLYGTDQWATYASVIPQDTPVQSKATTHAIERDHCPQRHWFGRFKRKSIRLCLPSSGAMEIRTSCYHYLIEAYFALSGADFYTLCSQNLYIPSPFSPCSLSAGSRCAWLSPPRSVLRMGGAPL
jgi:IS1 family transposase